MDNLLHAARLLATLAQLRKSGGNTIQPSAPHSIYYVRRVSSQPTPHYGDRFGQTWEPAGEYMAPVDGPRDPAELQPHGEIRGAAGRTWFEHGQIHFQNPVVIHRGEDDYIGWKQMLSQHFGGKTGAKLSEELKRRGHDGIVVKEPSGQRPDEVVNLGGAKDILQPFPAEAQRYLGPRRAPRRGAYRYTIK